MYFVLISYVLYLEYHLRKNHHRIRSKEFLERSGVLMRGIDVHRNYYAKYYWVVFLARRLIFVSMPLILVS